MSQEKVSPTSNPAPKFRISQLVWVYPADNIVGGEIKAGSIKELSEDWTRAMVVFAYGDPKPQGCRINSLFASLAEAEHARRGDVVALEFDRWVEIPILLYALQVRLTLVTGQYEMLKITRDRDLTAKERIFLPQHMQTHTREELREQIDSWMSLTHDYTALLERLRKAEQEADAIHPMPKLKKERP